MLLTLNFKYLPKRFHEFQWRISHAEPWTINLNLTVLGNSTNFTTWHSTKSCTTNPTNCPHSKIPISSLSSFSHTRPKVGIGPEFVSPRHHPIILLEHIRFSLLQADAEGKTFRRSSLRRHRSSIYTKKVLRIIHVPSSNDFLAQPMTTKADFFICQSRTIRKSLV